MIFKNKAKKLACAILSVILMTGNLMSGMTAYAITENPGNEEKNGNKPRETIYTESAYVNDTPLRLQISKVKTAPGAHEGIAPDQTEAEQNNTITYMISGRIDGSESDIIKKYGSDQVKFAYSSAGNYLGYGWKKGTLEYLLNRQAQALDENVQIIHNEYNVFDGFAYITRTLETADDVNRYVAGATMALYDAVGIFRDPSITNDESYYGEDERFVGVTVMRDEGSNNVTSVYVNKGYAGTQVEYVLQKQDGSRIEIDKYGNIIDGNYNYQDAINDIGDGTWIAKTIQREDTPILFYSLDNLRITSNDVYTNRHSENSSMLDETFGAERLDKKNKLYGFDKTGNVVDITQKDELDFSVYAFEAGTNLPVFEFADGDFSKIRYHMPEKAIEVGTGTVIYHLDKDGNRDSMIDPQTGIAYIEETDSRLFVWPVNVFYDGSGANAGNSNGSKTFQKIMTTRIATINADTAEEYTTGTYNGTSFSKTLNPVLDQYGHPVYYRKSEQTYTKGEDTWDYDGDEYTGYKYKDSLDSENEDAYTVNDHKTLYNGDLDDPFNQSTHYQYSSKQAVKVTVDTEHNYIANGESKVPVPTRSGYVFAGWLMEPDQLTDGCTVKAYWRNQNSSGMNEDERQQWYSDRAPVATSAKTITVTFDANGGEFRNGSGDIHSTDNILYRRLGDAYLMENIWVTGENTPNDPFDIRKVDTIGNTADNANTISNRAETGNDVYSSINAGGQADMLKRVNAGEFIMEEISAPQGFVTGFPVGVTVKEDTQLQYAEMTDETIKVELIKADATESYERNLYIDGVLQMNDAGTNTKVNEDKGRWSFTHVPGAVLSLKANDEPTKKMFSDWVKVTGNSQITKKNDGGYYYFEFTTDAPLFLEGIPAGNYTVSEVTAPDGYVKMENQNITISQTGGVQIFTAADDHTKVEIEKYYNDGTGNKNLSNAYRAGLSLIDRGGNVVAEWNTDDLSDYMKTNSQIKQKTGVIRGFFSLFRSDDSSEKSFIELFTEKINSGDTIFSQISWEVNREATKAPYSTDAKETWIISDGSRIVCENKNAPDDVPQAFKDAYNTRNPEASSFEYKETMSAVKDNNASPTMSDQIWDVSNGTRMHICVYGDNAQGENGRQSYVVEFQFNYRDDYSGSYTNTVSYDTVDGRHRFDYLPAGTFTLKEISTPEGFVTAADKTMVVYPNGDVQRFMLENKQKRLVIAKTALKDGSYYAGTENGSAVGNADPKYAAVIAGAKLELYVSDNQIADYEQAFSDGTIPAGALLADSWTSGTDGTYTEVDYKAELIRKDQIGDYKPHMVTDIKNGWYYLIEKETPNYYKTFAVKEIHVTDKTTSDVLTEICAVNEPIPLEVKVHKANEKGSPLSGAVFCIRNKTLGGTEVGIITTDETGYGSLVITDTGRFITDGKLEPYTFTIQEVSAPAGYQLDSEIHEFAASADHHGITTTMENKADASIVDGVLYVTDKPSQLTISKADFQDGSAVPGSKLAVYEAEFSNGKWKSTGKQENNSWSWIVRENEDTHTVSGLTAGGVYVLREEAVPEGYTKADDIFFKVSAVGTSIEKIWYDPEENHYVSFQTDTTGAVESVTFSTHTVLGTYVTLTNLTDHTVENKGTLKGGIVHLSSKDVTDGTRYQMKEYVRYSDGTEDCLSTTTFIAKLYNDWMKLDLNKDLQDLTVEITDEKGTVIASFKPDATGTYTVNNPLMSEPDQLEVVGSIMQKHGVNHKAVQAGNQIRYRVSYTGAGREIVIFPSDGLTYIHTGGAKLAADGTYRFTTAKDSGELTVIGKVTEEAVGYINQQVSVGEYSHGYLNPIAVNHGDGVFEKSSKLVISSAVAGTNQNNENAAFTFKITLTAADGSPLPGAYDYRTRNSSGRLHAYGAETDFEITVNGNDFITVRDLPYNTSYRVVQIVPGNYDFVVTNTEATGKTSNTEVSNVLFTNTRNETSERTLFEKNKGYRLSERLNFTDGTSLILTKYGFSFGEKCEIENITILNKETEVWFSKTDWTDSEEIEGAACVLMEEDGNVVIDELGNPVQWISGKEPAKFKGVLEPGKTYRYHEELAPDGYGYSEDVIFTVSSDGTIDKVIMQDKPTEVFFSKEDFAGAEIPGAECELKIKEQDGRYTVIDSWVSEIIPHKIAGTLTPGAEYLYHEAGAPNGYSYCEDIAFSLDKNGQVMNAHYVDKDGDTILFDGDGHTTDIKVITGEDGNVRYEQNHAEIIIVDKNAVDAAGNIVAKNVQTEIDVHGNVIQMKDQAFSIFLCKEDFAGKEIPGAACELERVNSDGSTSKIDKWISGDKPHIVEKELFAGGIYRYKEELAPGGFGHSEAIEFTINKDGSVADAHYINEKCESVLFDKDGYPTTIIAHEDGTYTDEGHTIKIDESGNAVDENGEIHAEGVGLDIPVVNSAVIMKDAPTQMKLLKQNENGIPIPGAKFQIINADKTEALAFTDTKIPSTEHEGYIKKGEKLIFHSNGSTGGILITGQLVAGKDYILREITQPAGYIAANDRLFHVPYKNQKEPVTVTLKNFPTRISFTKEDFAGEELSGAECALEKVNPDGSTTQIEKWVSNDTAHEMEGILETNTIYRYKEELAPEGYGYSESIEFTVNKYGIVTNAYYINEMYEPILFDKEGYPTTIVVHEDGTYTDAGHLITIDERGNAVDENGEIHAEGVELNIPVENNTAVMKDALTEMFFQKVDPNGAVLSGGKFQILTKDKKPVKAVKDTKVASTEHEGMILAGELLIFQARPEGINIAGQLKAGTEYFLREIEAPAAHIAGADEGFRIPYLNQKKPLQVPMKNTPTKITLTKEDFAGEEIPGAECKIERINPDGSTTNISKWVSNGSPHEIEGVLEINTTYRYKEEMAPEGFGYSEGIEFTVNKDGIVTDAHYINEKNEPILFDKEGYPTTIVVYEDGTYMDEGRLITINESGDAVDESGEIHAEGVKFKIPVENNIIVMKDAPTKVLIQKVNQDKTALSGGLFQILNTDGTPVTAIRDSIEDMNGIIHFKKGEQLIFEATEDGVDITGMLRAGTHYMLRELAPPAGYVTGTDQSFYVPYLNSKEPIHVVMVNEPTRANIQKVDTENKPVKGAKLEIRDAQNGDLVDNWTSDGTPHEVTGTLSINKEYILIEEESPTGYYRSGPVSFRLLQTENTTEVTMVNKPVILKLIKVQKGTGTPVSGGKFSVLDKTDSSAVIPEFTLNGELIVTEKLEAGKTYLFHEIEAPSGFHISGDVEFTVPLTQEREIIEVVMEDSKITNGGGGGSHSEPPSITFKKYDGVTMKALPGAEFTVYDSKGKVYKTVTTGADGYAYLSFTSPGKYSYKETKAPNGYKPDDTVYEFEITLSTNMTVPVANYEEPPHITILKKDSDTGELIQGVRFEIINENGTAIYTGITDSYGQVTFAPGQFGSYAVFETSVPDGYVCSNGYITFTVSKGGIEGETVFYNDKSDIPPITPDNPGKKAGIISVSYDNGADGYGKGWYDRDGNWHPFADIGKTGDVYPFILLALFVFGGLSGLIITKKKGSKDE